MAASLDEDHLRALFQRNGLDPSPEDLRHVARAFEGYRPQLEALLALDLDGEEVGTSFLPCGGA